MTRRVIFVLLGVAGANSQTAAQTSLQRERTSNPVLDNPLIDPKQSSVYMEFKRVGKCPPMAGESSDQIWLTLRNNTRWPILVKANGVPDDCYGEASPFYRVEATGSLRPDGPIPSGHWIDVSSLVEIGPGELLTFSVPRSHLDPGLSIGIDFKFNWEQNDRYTRHSSYFSYWDLPQTLRDKEKEKKLKSIPEFKIIPPPKAPNLP